MESILSYNYSIVQFTILKKKKKILISWSDSKLQSSYNKLYMFIKKKIDGCKRQLYFYTPWILLGIGQ